MKKMYAFVTNEKRDKSISDAVNGIFEDYGGIIPLGEFKDCLCRRLRQSADLVQIISLEKTPLANVERKYNAIAYRVIDDAVYQTEPETS